MIIKFNHSFIFHQEFVKWVHKNPKLVDNIFVIQCPTPSGEVTVFYSYHSLYSIFQNYRIARCLSIYISLGGLLLKYRLIFLQVFKVFGKPFSIIAQEDINIIYNHILGKIIRF